jgi:hypothetical protein
MTAPQLIAKNPPGRAAAPSADLRVAIGSACIPASARGAPDAPSGRGALVVDRGGGLPGGRVVVWGAARLLDSGLDVVGATAGAAAFPIGMGTLTGEAGFDV